MDLSLLSSSNDAFDIQREGGWMYPSVLKDVRRVMRASSIAALQDERLPTLAELDVDFETSLRQDLEADARARDAATNVMDTNDNAALEAQSAGPDVSARVVELMRNLQKVQDFEDEYELEELEEYEDVFGDDEDEDEHEEHRMDQLGDDEDGIDELYDEE